MTTIMWEPKARAALRNLPRHHAARIARKLGEVLALDPLRYLEHLAGHDFYKLRIGEYRLFADYYPGEGLLVVRSLRHRRNAYK